MTTTTQAPPQAPAVPDVWHIVEHPAGKSGYTIVNAADRRVGFAFKPGSARLFVAGRDYHTAAKQLLQDHAALQAENRQAEPCDCDFCTTFRPIVERVEASS